LLTGFLLEEEARLAVGDDPIAHPHRPPATKISLDATSRLNDFVAGIAACHF
jgi:hypothetical protein